jgi:hypothetical protein
LTKPVRFHPIVPFRCAGRVGQQKGKPVTFAVADGKPNPALRPQL